MRAREMLIVFGSLALPVPPLLACYLFLIIFIYISFITKVTKLLILLKTKVVEYYC